MSWKRRLLVTCLAVFVVLVPLTDTEATALARVPFAMGPEGQSEDRTRGDCIHFGSDVGIEALQMIKLGQCSIINNGNGTVTVTGSTAAYYPVEYLYVRLYLQRWDGSRWGDIKDWLDQASTADYAYGSHTSSVTRGNYYRVRATHYAADGALEEYAYSYSSSIYVE
ncbi:MAG: DUF6147 family protein [Ignavibacteriales bacterium]